MAGMGTGGAAMTDFMAGVRPPTEIPNRNQDADYVRLGHNEESDLEMEEFELSVPEANHKRKRLLWWLKVVAGSLFVIAGLAAFIYWGLPFVLDKILIPMLIWEASTFSKPTLALVLVLSLALFPVFMLPSGPSMWLSGMIFGYGYGFLIIIGGTLVGQSLPYVIGRWLLHDRIQEYLLKWPKQAAVLRIAEQGTWFYQFRAIAVLRVSPFPYPVFNYAITGTNITFWPYISGSMAGMVPEAFITIYSGKMLKDLADLKQDKMPLTWPKIIYYSVSFTIAVTILVAITILGRRALADLEIREAAEREIHETQMRGVVDDVEEGDGAGIKRSTSWNGEGDSRLSSLRKSFERARS